MNCQERIKELEAETARLREALAAAEGAISGHTSYKREEARANKAEKDVERLRAELAAAEADDDDDGLTWPTPEPKRIGKPMLIVAKDEIGRLRAIEKASRDMRRLQTADARDALRAALEASVR